MVEIQIDRGDGMENRIANLQIRSLTSGDTLTTLAQRTPTELEVKLLSSVTTDPHELCRVPAGSNYR